MSENKLTLEPRTATGKKLRALRAAELIPSVVYGDKDTAPVLTQSPYNITEKIAHQAGYHSTVDLTIGKNTQLALIKAVDIDPVSRKILNLEFQAVSADKPVEATAPIVIENFESSEASKLHYALLPVLEEVAIKAKPADLPDKITADASKLATTEDKLTIASLALPKGVTLADKELSPSQPIANVYDPAAEAAAREAADQQAETTPTEATTDQPNEPSDSTPTDSPAK